MEAASHVWLSIENDPDMYIPAQAVHRQGGHVTLLASRDTRNGSSEQRIVIPEARFRELPRADPTELHMLSQPNFALNDAALLTMPSEPALLHLLRRRFNTGRRCTAVGPWLIVLGDPSVYDEAPGEEEVHATSRKNAGLYLNEAEPSMAELAARVHIRMLTLRRPQAVVLLGGAAGGAADATAELLRFLRRVQDSRCNAHGSRLAARAEAAVGVLHAFADAAAAFGDRTGGLGGCNHRSSRLQPYACIPAEAAAARAYPGCICMCMHMCPGGLCGWLRLRFDSAGRLQGGVLRGALLTGCRAGSCAKGVSAPRVFYLLLAGATALEREELTLPDSATAAACTSAGEALQREDVPSRAR